MQADAGCEFARAGLRCWPRESRTAKRGARTAHCVVESRPHGNIAQALQDAHSRPRAAGQRCGGGALIPVNAFFSFSNSLEIPAGDMSIFRLL
jgi:hypothetical protein